MNDLLKAHTLLVIPSEDLQGMLVEGPCGFRPPTSFKDGDWHPNDTDPPYNADTYGVEAFALVLRWEGQDLPHGWVAAERSLGWNPWGSPMRLIEDLLPALRERGCTLIALDERGKEMTDD